MTDSITHPAYCQSCDEYYEYADGLCWQCWHDEGEVLCRKNIEAEQEYKAEQKEAARECK